MNVLLLDERSLRRCVSVDEQALKSIEDAFTWFHQGRVSMPPIMHIEVAEHRGDVDIKSAYVSGIDQFAVKIASGFFENPKRGLASSSAMVVVLSSQTGFCEAVLLDNGYLTDLRTGLAGAVAAKYLAPASVNTVGVVGTGVQARYQLQCLALVRRFDRVLVHGRTPEHATRCVDDLAALLEVDVVMADGMEHLVTESQVVVTTTAATEALVRAEWLHPGLHITAMGSDLPGKRELEVEVLARADRVVCDSRSQCAAMGELQHAVAAGLLTANDAVEELGALTSGEVPGRTRDDEITVCDLTGAGVQDTAIATLALAKARANGLGSVIRN